MVGNGLATDWDNLRFINMHSSKLYVGNLSFKTSEDELRAHFEQYGAVTDVYIALDRDSGRPRGFAFVTMGSGDEAKLAAEKANGVDLGGRALTVNEARPKEDRPAGGGFGGGPRRSFGGGGGGERRGGFGGGDRGDRGDRGGFRR
jgi:RNA recognition motif-containing protein